MSVSYGRIDVFGPSGPRRGRSQLTTARLAAVARTLQATPPEVDLLCLCDSETTLDKVLRWIGSDPRTTLAVLFVDRYRQGVKMDRERSTNNTRERSTNNTRNSGTHPKCRVSSAKEERHWGSQHVFEVSLCAIIKHGEAKRNFEFIGEDNDRQL